MYLTPIEIAALLAFPLALALSGLVSLYLLNNPRPRHPAPPYLTRRASRH